MSDWKIYILPDASLTFEIRIKIHLSNNKCK